MFGNQIWAWYGAVGNCAVTVSLSGSGTVRLQIFG
jgi:hypothetical protein